MYMLIKGNFWWFKFYTTCGHINSQVALSTATGNLCIWTLNIISHFYAAYRNRWQWLYTTVTNVIISPRSHQPIEFLFAFSHLQPTLYKRKAKRIFTFISTAFDFCSAIDECRMCAGPAVQLNGYKNESFERELMSKPYLSTRHGIYIYIYT